MNFTSQEAAMIAHLDAIEQSARAFRELWCYHFGTAAAQEYLDSVNDCAKELRDELTAAIAKRQEGEQWATARGARIVSLPDWPMTGDLNELDEGFNKHGK